MVFKSFTYDSSEMDLQYALDEKGNEIREIIYDTGFSGMNTHKQLRQAWTDSERENWQKICIFHHRKYWMNKLNTHMYTLLIGCLVHRERWMAYSSQAFQEECKERWSIWRHHLLPDHRAQTHVLCIQHHPALHPHYDHCHLQLLPATRCWWGASTQICNILEVYSNSLILLWELSIGAVF